MNNDADGFGSFWFWFAVVANYCQIESYQLNLKQTSNDELLKHLNYQDNVLLSKIIKQNEIIIQQNDDILKLMKGGKYGN